MDPIILNGHSIQQVKGATVIFDNLGRRWHDFGQVVPMDAAMAVIAAYKAGVDAGRKLVDQDAGRVLETLKDIASRAHAAIAKAA